ncbi:MAG: hypothetical protein BAJALOKI3v1_620027 [Promethearchaeota archaeon]|nr:MAG: hypothetical protein BAJALOKI3v1_620027 [Candidatus Lokiarchaeota archaeon]
MIRGYIYNFCFEKIDIDIYNLYSKILIILINPIFHCIKVKYD